MLLNVYICNSHWMIDWYICINLKGHWVCILVYIILLIKYILHSQPIWLTSYYSELHSTQGGTCLRNSYWLWRGVWRLRGGSIVSMTDNTPVSGWRSSEPGDNIIVCNRERIFLHGVLVILKPTLQNYKKILDNLCILMNVYNDIYKYTFW